MSLEDSLDAALDALVGRAAESGGADVEGLDAAAALRRALATSPGPAARAAHVRMIMEAAREAPAGATPPAREAPRRARRRVSLLRVAFSLGLAALLALPATVAMAAQAKPGEALYDLKLAVEKVRLAATRDAAAEARLHVEFAQRRLEELEWAAGAGVHQRHVRVAIENLKQHQAGAGSAIGALRATQAKTGRPGEKRAEAEATVESAAGRHQEVLSALAARANCSGTPDAPQGDPQCHGLLTALENSQKMRESLQRAKPRPAGPETPATPTSTAGEADDDDSGKPEEVEAGTPAAGNRPADAPAGGPRPSVAPEFENNSDSPATSRNPERRPQRAGTP